MVGSSLILGEPVSGGYTWAGLAVVGLTVTTYAVFGKTQKKGGVRKAAPPLFMAAHDAGARDAGDGGAAVSLPPPLFIAT